ncbi:MAG: IS66 family insertion sequence element accessory protein TnpA [Bacillota bacterium]
MTQAEREKLWEARIADYRASGQSVREWCANNTIRPDRLWYWLRKYKPLQEANNYFPRSKDDPGRAVDWLPAELVHGTVSPEQAAAIRCCQRTDPC